jgi:hypothetical protein
MKAIKKTNQEHSSSVIFIEDFGTKIHIELIIVIAKINFLFYQS